MYKKLTGIGVPRDTDYLWRYMSFEKLANLLYTKALFFTRADKFDDPFEGFTPPSVSSIYQDATTRFEKDDLNIPSKLQGATLKFLENWRKYVMCSCWHYADQESMAMWEKYHLHNSGVAIKTTLGNFKKCLPSSPDIFIGKIKYIDHNRYQVPQNLSAVSMIYTWYFHKKIAFEHEREFRAIIDSHPYIMEYFNSHGGSVDLQTIQNYEFPDIYEIGTPVKIDVETLFGEKGEVIISPYAEKWITKTVESVVHQYGFKFPVSRSRLLDPPA